MGINAPPAPLRFTWAFPPALEVHAVITASSHDDYLDAVREIDAEFPTTPSLWEVEYCPPRARWC